MIIEDGVTRPIGRLMCKALHGLWPALDADCDVLANRLAARGGALGLARPALVHRGEIHQLRRRLAFRLEPPVCNGAAV